MLQDQQKFIQILGWVATFTAICMYVSYIPQIMNNLAGHKGNPIQPFVAAINCLLWVIYGLKRKDYPLAAANAPSILFGAAACFTAL
ncbi:SemiSWEET family transporter [Acinetobacter soli]|uniref:SemiSWEET family transporter n=1 Tax=Acinetobacter soli TaxID=487316 RepID=UPI000E6A9F2D|nr:SemiSWEET family transporter [Acinetobacter soli]